MAQCDPTSNGCVCTECVKNKDVTELQQVLIEIHKILTLQDVLNGQINTRLKILEERIVELELL
jgi:hypothetical protein